MSTFRFLAIVLLIGVSSAFAYRPLTLENGVSYEVVVTGKLLEVSRGTFSTPDARKGRIEVTHVIKGEPAADQFWVNFPKEWGPPSTQARLGHKAVWIFIIFSLCGIAVIIGFPWLKRKWHAIPLLAICVLIASAAYSFEFNSGFRRPDWPATPTSILGVEYVWVVQDGGNGYVKAKPFPIESCLNSLEDLKKLSAEDRAYFEKTGSWEVLMALDRYLQNAKSKVQKEDEK